LSDHTLGYQEHVEHAIVYKIIELGEIIGLGLETPAVSGYHHLRRPGILTFCKDILGMVPPMRFGDLESIGSQMFATGESLVCPMEEESVGGFFSLSLVPHPCSL
jgi:hypothetical protein